MWIQGLDGNITSSQVWGCFQKNQEVDGIQVTTTSDNSCLRRRNRWVPEYYLVVAAKSHIQWNLYIYHHPPSNCWRKKMHHFCLQIFLTNAFYWQNITGNTFGNKFQKCSSPAVSPEIGGAHRREKEWFCIAQKNAGTVRDEPCKNLEFRKVCERSYNPLQATLQRGWEGYKVATVKWKQQEDQSYWVNVLYSATILYSDHILKFSGSSEVFFCRWKSWTVSGR